MRTLFEPPVGRRWSPEGGSASPEVRGRGQKCGRRLGWTGEWWTDTLDTERREPSPRPQQLMQGTQSDWLSRAPSDNDPRSAGPPAEFKHINKRRRRNLRGSSSNGERTGKSPAWESGGRAARIVVGRSVLRDGQGPSPMDKSAREGENPVRPGPCCTTRRCQRVRLFGNAALIGR